MSSYYRKCSLALYAVQDKKTAMNRLLLENRMCSLTIEYVLLAHTQSKKTAIKWLLLDNRSPDKIIDEKNPGKTFKEAKGRGRPSLTFMNSVSVYLFIYLSICFSVCLSVYPSIHPSICLFVCLSVHLSIYLSI